ncbi:hypothetical protein XA68_17315 [Ophiocordyceps unilateralis]|uniref:RSE1/DDB1/CPSF1 first beta-propeller domain-containing protein n=1 Tax=Ophiocordyceps unilateralis TaxID=268505 RepID=A0A2A9P521_OPHUN|nr:hypothetical protein XA68_17315 [Ophiocordyceps unilateralis]
MAFQSSVLRDGEWVTETVNFQSALRQATAAATAGPVDQRPEPSTFGLLSRTIVQSPIVHRVLPVRLRSKLHNDIAFIGDRFVQISELRRDGQVHEIAYKKDFGSRIRSAAVLGDSSEHGLDDEAPGDCFQFESDDSTTMVDVPDVPNGSPTRQLPPQLLVLILETGDTIFLFLRAQPGSPIDFVSSTYTLPRRIPYLGYHLAIDPTSRYMACASPEGVLVMFELEDPETLNAQYTACDSICPVKSVRLRLLHGVLHKLEFLHPLPEDYYHIILILIVIRRERSRTNPVTRMIIYEWEVGDCLKEVFAGERCGSRLPQEHRMPLLLIPLRFNTAFFTVSEKSIGIVKDCLSGSPVFESLGADPPSQTVLHHGVRLPLWTAWARPFRRQKYFEKTDIIYLAREDGAIIHIEIETGDLMPFITNVGCLDANINTAFTAAYDIYSDILIIGGDSGPGGIWKLAPRSELEQVSVLPNWSPVVDVAASGYCPAGIAASTERGTGATAKGAPKPLPKPDGVFTASGRGSKGSVTQWRWGFQARIVLDIESGDPIRHAWAFEPDTGRSGGGLCALLAFPDSSALLRFSKDFSQVEAATDEDTEFDLESRTLDACCSQQGTIVQVTERSVTLCASLKSVGAGTRLSLDEILAIDNVVAGNASCSDDTIAISSFCERGYQLHTLLVTQMGLRQRYTWEAPGDITCVSLFATAGTKYVIASSMLDGIPWIFLYTLAGETVAAKAISHLNYTSSQGGQSICPQYESLTGICHIQESAGEVYLAAGTRCGHLVTVKITSQEAEPISLTTETIGLAPVEVFPSLTSFRGTAAVLVSRKASCPLSFMAQAGSRFLLAEIWPDVGLVPRVIPLEGTPTRLIYSQTWNCLVVALLKGDKPTLAFIDPDSGETISSPADRDGKAAEFITGLGHAGDRIFCLHEWLYVKDGKTFTFILVTTKDGRLLIVSVGSRKVDGKRLRYWTRCKRAFGKPIYSVVGDDQGIIYCVDKTIRWDVLDLAEKKLRLVSEYQLDSSATTLCVARGHLLALTTMHSMEVIDYSSKRGGGMTLIHSDRVSRSTIHMIETGAASAGHNGWPVTLLSDEAGGVAGIRIPSRQQSKEFNVIFETMLPTSVRRFVRARSRPLWLAGGNSRRYANLTDRQDGAEILGVSLDGSLQHFTILGLDLWRFLCLIQNMARTCSDMSLSTEYTVAGGRQEAQVDEAIDMNLNTELDCKEHPKGLHVDGDLLERCLRQRGLEELLQKRGRFILFCGCLDKLEGGRFTQRLRDTEVTEQVRRGGYIGLGYDILAYLLDPVL